MTVPLATYRLQLRPGFGFDEVAAVADYLAALGVSHVYLSPYLQAAKGSTHGYDVVDPSRVNSEIGGAPAHARMIERLRASGLGQVIDVVPNHMSIATAENRFWWDLLEHGASSRYAEYFDIDWRPPDARLRDKVLRPILADHYGRVLESGGIRVRRGGVRFELRVHDQHVLPLAPASVANLLARAASRSGNRELAFVADVLSDLPDASHGEPARTERRYRDVEVLFHLLQGLLEQPALGGAVDAVLDAVNASVDALDELIEQQNYRIAYWRLGRHDLDYRRFFDIDTLAALRAERADVFRDTHLLVLEFVRSGEATGLRIDHPDGLRDPGAYFARLRERAPEAWIVAEKILGPDERLPESWPIDGTTGYDFMALATGLQVDPAGEQALSELFAQFGGGAQQTATAVEGGAASEPPFESVARDRKRFVLDELLSSELGRLTAVLVEVCERHPRFRDYSRRELRDALSELIACMPVYRTYVRPGMRAEARDLAYLERAASTAEHARPHLDRRLLRFVERVLRGALQGSAEAELIARFQQLSAAAMAKGVEDTAFYTYPRLLALNEVGSDPGRFGISVEQFHARCAFMQQRYPATMLSTSTHDSKRSEDVRARIALLSQIPERWRDAVQRWSELAARYRSEAGPDPVMEYYVYQTLAGAFPIEPDRLLAHLHKAMRESKAHSSWLSPNEAYERAVLDFARHVLSDERLRADIARFTDALVAPARATSLVQLVLKLTAPGVPDIYQGNEIWRHDLTDPDNRRPIDFDALRAKLARVRDMTVAEALQDRDADLSKLFVTQRLLALRKREPAAFGSRGDYCPLSARGPGDDHMIAFSRGERVVVACARLLMRVGDDWRDTTLHVPEGRFEDALSGAAVHGGAVAAADLFARLPAAVLVRA